MSANICHSFTFTTYTSYILLIFPYYSYNFIPSPNFTCLHKLHLQFIYIYIYLIPFTTSPLSYSISLITFSPYLSISFNTLIISSLFFKSFFPMTKSLSSIYHTRCYIFSSFQSFHFIYLFSIFNISSQSLAPRPYILTFPLSNNFPFSFNVFHFHSSHTPLIPISFTSNTNIIVSQILSSFHPDFITFVIYPSTIKNSI